MFVHLHVHSEYSLLDGACQTDKLLDRLVALEQTAVAITDHGTMYGAIQFYKKAREKGIKPIMGCEVYVAPRTRFDKSFGQDNGANHMVLLCKNNVGYQNLIHMVTLGYSEGFYNRPRIDEALLEEYSEGLICLSACLAGKIPSLLMDGDYDAAKATALKYQDIFGADSFYLEIQDHGLQEQGPVNAGLFRLSKETGIPLVATNDAHYLTRDDAALQDVLMCIQMGKTVDDPQRMRFESDQFYIKSFQEMADLFPNHREALLNTTKIAAMCNVEIEFGNYHLPQFDVPAPYTALDYLKKLCDEGFAKRYSGEENRERLHFEINMIAQMGFIDYFLIVSDFIAYAKKSGIAVGPGRGSAAGSIVSYCLGITDLDPIKYGLYFERFLNPERVSMPDIDIDFCYVRRQEVIEYVVEKYGKDKVAQIVTFGTMAAKAAIRDVGRALSMPYADVDRLAKLVPTDLGMTLEKALKASAELKGFYENDDAAHRLLDMAMSLEGMPRHASTHAAGVVITKEPVDHYVPLAKNDDTLVTQFTMNTLEELGLLKMDFLGLRNLTVIQDALVEIQRTHPDFSLASIDLTDKATYAMLSAGKTAGIFQLESVGITSVVTRLRPEHIEDIIAIGALYRPGPMQSIPRYIEGRHHPEKAIYKHDLLKPILSVTYGCIVYQEQVMEVFRQLGGYSLGKADMVRRAMSKKKMKELARERENFIFGNEELGIEGCLIKGVSEKIANEIFDEILDFANYAFNKAHAAAYALITFQTAYLKCHYTREYMAALLTSVLDSPLKIAEYTMECKDMGIAVLPPNVNTSVYSFSVAGESISFGMAAIKNVGKPLVTRMIQERDQNGAFACFDDFVNRMQDKDMNKRAVESFIKSGTLDCFGHFRAQLLRVFDFVLEGAAQARRKNIDGQIDLFGGMAEENTSAVSMPNIPECTKTELLAMEKETTGLYLSGHPMDEYEALTQGTSPILDIVGEEPKVKDGQKLFLAGILSGVKLKTTRAGAMMAFVNIEDKSGMMELVVFPKTLQICGSNVKDDVAVLVSGRISFREEEPPKLLCDEIRPLTEQYVHILVHKNKSTYPRPKPLQTLYVQLPTLDEDKISEIRGILKEFSGDVPAVIYLQDTKKKIQAPRELWVRSDIQLLNKLRLVLGEENVIIK